MTHNSFCLALIIGIATTGLISACSVKGKTPQVRYDSLSKTLTRKPQKHPVKVVVVPKPLPLPGQLKKRPYKKGIKAKQIPVKQRIAHAKLKAKLEPTAQGFINAIQVYPYTKGALYRLYGAVNQVSDISLQPGEQLQSVSAGDTVRWIVDTTTSGRGSKRQVHILVKPIAAQLQTNLIINTDRRTYHLELVSDDSTYMSSVSWTYPQERLIMLTRKTQKRSERTDDIHPDPARLNFRYRIKGSAPWKPVKVYDDGSKVYIRFPSGLSQGDAPPLFVLGRKGTPTLVNYRVKGSTYIVDRLFAAAQLRLGKTRITITRRDVIWK